MFLNKLPSPPSSSQIDSSTWKDWFTNLYKWQRTEDSFVPEFTGLTVGGAGGTVVHTARFYKIGNMVYVYGLLKTNATGTLTSVNGTTYINNLPFPVHQVLNYPDSFGHIGSVINATTGAYIAPCYTLSSPTVGTNELRLYFGAFGPTTADHDVIWSCWYQSNA